MGGVSNVTNAGTTVEGEASQEVAISALQTAVGECGENNPAVAAGQGLLNQGRLGVNYAYYQTTGEASIALTSANHGVAVLFVPESMYSIGSIALRIAAVTSAATLTIKIHSDNGLKPGSALATLGTLASGDASAWKVGNLTAYGLTPGVRYWVSCFGEDTKNVSLSARRANTVCGSAHPDGCIAMTTTDGGTNWSALTQDSLPALWNMILNPADPVGDGSKPVPKLFFGSTLYGNLIYIPDTGNISIPTTGVFLDCSALSTPNAVFGYHVFAYDSSGLTLEATTDALAITNGVVHKLNAVGHRWLGDIYPVQAMAGQFGAVDVRDQRLVSWPGRRMSVAKTNPYSDAQTETISGTSWQCWKTGTDEWRVEFLTCGMATVQLQTGLRFAVAGNYAVQNIGIDGLIPTPRAEGCQNLVANSRMGSVLSDMVRPGFHYAYPLIRGLGSTCGVQYHGAAYDTPEAFFGGVVETS